MMSVSWFCSSFESSSNSDQATTDCKLLRKAPVSHITTDNAIIDYEVIETPPEVAFCTSLGEESTCPLIDRFPVQNVEQLAVNPRKVDEIRQWMRKKKERYRGCKLLLLTGPTGCGKTTTVKMLCHELKLELIEWNCSESYDVFYNPEGEEVIYEESQVREFAEFLKSSDRGSIEKSISEKVILIEQLPNVFYQDPAILHATLKNTIKNTVCMYIFIMSDIGSCWYLNPKRVLPANIRYQLGFEELAFNASATIFLSKALRRIASLLKINISPLQIKRIANNSNGDIRTAIHNLQLCFDGSREFIEIFPFHSSTLIDPYRSLGKLLYAKRCDSADDNWKKAEEKLKIELREFYSRDYPPKDDVSEVLNKSGMKAEKLVIFIHEHELNFAPSLSSYLSILNNISIFDSALGRWEVQIDSILSSYIGEVAARSTVFYNFGCKSRQGRGMYRFHKPRCHDEDFQLFSREKEIYAAFPSHIYGEILTLTLPLIRLIRPPTLNNYQNQLLISMDSALCTSFTVKQSPTNRMPSRRSAIYDEDNQFDIEEIDLS
uniref:AAA+ ATPase domain-containing protein n=1 Tax=Onchocerca volvulus TaxID=6282 RepID=A0A8R1TIZ2_ONCVO